MACFTDVAISLMVWLKTWSRLLVTGACILFFILHQRPRMVSMTGIQGPVWRRNIAGRKSPLLGVSWKSADMTAVIALQSKCEYSIASMGLFRHISELMTRSNGRLALVVISPEPGSVVASLLAKNDIRTNSVLQSDLGSIGVPGTPTITLVDSGGIIRGHYVGLLSEGRQKALLELLERYK